MKFKLLILIILLCLWASHPSSAFAYGAELSYPAAAVYGILQGYSSQHQAYDYAFPNHSQVAAAKAGTIVTGGSTFQYTDGYHSGCTGGVEDRGNYIILDHGSNVQTRYFHLSNTGNTPAPGASFSRADYMALSDDTGCSSVTHLHFSVMINGSFVDPYAGGTQWVSGSPIPMGYTVGSTTYGPFRIIGAVQDKWVSIQGAAGSPMNVEHCPANSPGVPNSDDGVVQDFTSNTSRILWSGATSVHWVYGAISAKYVDVGGPWPNPAPGYPTSDEYQWGTYRRTDFDRGYITWRSDQGTIWNYTTYTSRSTCHW